MHLFRVSIFLTLTVMALSCRPDAKQGGGDMAVADTYLTDELSIQHGMELFNRHCASCHNFTANEIGPNLSGVTSEVSKDWLVDYIHDPKAKIDGGDPRAVAHFERYRLYMPGFPQIQGKDMDHLLGFIHKFSEAEKRNTSNRKGGLINPIPEPIPESGLVLDLEEWFTAPPTSPNPLLARINKLDRTGTRLFLADQRGLLYEITWDSVKTYLDIREWMPEFIDAPGFGSGLGNFAFHPEFASNGLFYTTHTEKAGSAPADFALPDSVPARLQWVLTEWESRSPGSDVFSGRKREILRADMVSQIHGFQELTFNPLSKPGNSDYGLLYLGIGDGGAGLGGYPQLCDNPSQIWGSVLCLDPSGTNSANGRYGIPKDNPYAGTAEGLGEVWASGFRNPHRITWDAETGHMFISNIGQHSVEEVNLGLKGADYGWPNREGTFLFDVQANSELVYPVPESGSRYTDPVIQYDHDEGNAVSGGYAYRGEALPLLRGYYVFGDIPRGTVFMSPLTEMEKGQPAPVFRVALESEGRELSLSEISLDARVDLRFAQDAQGELLLFTKNNGKVYRVVGCRDKTL
ncbi:PQQ-dependent sugar dehydrogenase [Robiginitalea sediminis]|uniref:PQQ-dependent sugar dehydrogenase n=1 Tax=Robiginitalea sediminis TaxID=1982593 RepID=UPI001303EFBB|nr:PQQ-dependent sugar dehydrogenase [Robiginitalea sediminis]